jgi:cyanophycinase
MILWNRLVALSVLYISSMILIIAAVAQPPSHGPTKGYLLVTGGATEPRDYQRLIDLAGGKNAKIVVIPNGSVAKPTDQAALQEQYCGAKSPFAAFPGVPCTVIYTTDHAVANSETFVAPLKSATGVWFVGGRHWRIADSYLDTLTLKEFFNLLGRGGVIGGGSAGATIQALLMRMSTLP